MLGFGTQFIDVELDGIGDLVITNGHVDDFREIGTPYQMPPQLLRRSVRTPVRFELAEFTPPSEYFDSAYLGRGLARLDFNRDGREDFAVSHLDSPVALVANETTEVGAFVSVRLIATSSARDAIGTRVRVDCGDL